MKNNSEKHLTLSIILADNVLNWFLGIVLTFFPTVYETWLFSQSSLPIFFFLLAGICFLLFSGWQVQVFLKNWKLDKKNLRIAAWLAWLPAVMLSATLLLPWFALHPMARAVLWVGNIYMIVLGWWYWRMAKKVK